MAEEKEKPLTREDVLRLIEENGGTAPKPLTVAKIHGIILPTRENSNRLFGVLLSAVGVRKMRIW